MKFVLILILLGATNTIAQKDVSGAIDGDLDPILGMYCTWSSVYTNFKLEGKNCAFISFFTTTAKPLRISAYENSFY
jgi:hypothetical protein